MKLDGRYTLKTFIFGNLVCLVLLIVIHFGFKLLNFSADKSLYSNLSIPIYESKLEAYIPPSELLIFEIEDMTSPQMDVLYKHAIATTAANLYFMEKTSYIALVHKDTAVQQYFKHKLLQLDIPENAIFASETQHSLTNTLAVGTDIYGFSNYSIANSELALIENLRHLQSYSQTFAGIALDVPPPSRGKKIKQLFAAIPSIFQASSKLETSTLTSILATTE